MMYLAGSKLLAFAIASTVVLYCFANLLRVSPRLITYSEGAVGAAGAAGTGFYLYNGKRNAYEEDDMM